MLRKNTDTLPAIPASQGAGGAARHHPSVGGRINDALYSLPDHLPVRHEPLALRRCHRDLGGETALPVFDGRSLARLD